MDQTTQLMALPNAWLDRLFLRLHGLYGSKFADMWRGQELDDVKALWGQELSGYSLDELKRGIESLRTKHPSWPPTLYEFADLCRPATVELDAEMAFGVAVRGLHARREGKMGDWPNKAIYWAAVDVSVFDVLGSSWPQIRARWTEALRRRSVDDNLPAIPEAPKQLPSPKGDRVLPEGIALAETLKAGKADPRVWAKKLLERAANGDKAVAGLPVRIATVAANGGVWDASCH